MSPLSRGWARWRMIFLYLCIGEEEDTPTRKRVTWSESLEQRLGTAEAEMQGKNKSTSSKLKDLIFFHFHFHRSHRKRGTQDLFLI
jgi:hypothetical protein